MSQTTSKTESLQTYNFRDRFKFYEVGPVITIHLQDESELTIILERLKKNKNIQILNVPKEIFHTSDFQDFFFQHVFNIFLYFDMKETKKNFVLTKKTITTGKYIQILPNCFYYVEDAKKILLDLKSNKNVEYIYVDTYLGSIDLTKKIIKKLEYKIIHEKRTKDYGLFKIKKI
jgi:hypothetical protein